MKMRYERPSMDVEQFMANEYIAACGDSGTNYLFECNAPKGDLYYFSKSDGVLDGIYNGNGGKKYIGGFSPCGKKHPTNSSNDFYEGFVDYNGNGTYDPNGGTNRQGKKTPPESVIVWIERGFFGSIKNAHATKNLDIDSWETAKS